MNQNLKSTVWSIVIVSFCIGILYGLQAKADALDQNDHAAVCGVAKDQAKGLITFAVSTLPTSISARLKTIEAQQSKDNKPTDAVYYLDVHLKLLEQTLKTFDPEQTLKLLESKLACNANDEAVDLEAKVIDARDKIAAEIAAIKKAKGDVITPK